MNTIAPTASTKSTPEPQPQPVALAPIPRAPALRAVILKEIRHNLIYMGLTFVIAVIIFLVSEDPVHTHDYNRLNILTSRSMEQTIALMSGIAALLLGFFQPLADRNFDLWAFSVHRPAPRSILFYGRVLAGLIMHFAAIGLPLILLLAYAMTSYGGDFFIWPFCLPAIAGFFVGLPFYFAGLLISDWRSYAHWWMLTPLAFPAGAASFTFLSPWFLLAVAGSLAASALLFVAARRSTLTHGFQLASKRRPIAATIVVLFSISIVLLPLTLEFRTRLAIKSDRIAEPDRRSYPAPIMPAWFSSHLITMPDGTPARVTDVMMQQNGVTHQLLEFYADLHGHGLLPSDDAQEKLHNDLTYVHRLTEEQPFPKYNYTDPSNLVYTYSRTLDKHNTITYYGVKDRHIFYVYNTNHPRPDVSTDESTNFVGILGANGLVNSPADAQPFDGPLQLPLLRANHAIYRLSPDGKGLTTLLQTGPDETISSVGDDQKKLIDESDTDLDAYYVFTSKRFLLISRLTGHVFTQFPLDLLPNASVVRVCPFPLSAPPTSAKSWEIYTNSMTNPYIFATARFEFRDARGNLLPDLTQTAPTYITSYPWWSVYYPPLSEKTRHKQQKLELRDGAWAACANPVFLIGCELAARQFSPEDMNVDGQTLNRRSPLMLPRIRASLFTMSLVLAASALAAFFLAWFYGASRWTWALIALLCGPSALLTLVAIRKFPRRIPLTNPTLTGTEIFS